MLLLAACTGTSTPSAPYEPHLTTRDAAAAPATSIIVRGSVVDASNRLLAGANVECLGNAVCRSRYHRLITEGHDHQVATTDANGFFEIVATSRTDGADGGFLMNANREGYQVEWHQIEWPDVSCTSDQQHCAVTVNFRLAPMAD